MTVDDQGRLASDSRYTDWVGWSGAVLLSNEILYYATDPSIPVPQRLIWPFDARSLDAARYNLRLGTEYRLNGEAHALSDKEPWLRLQPHQMALVETFEEVRLPRFLIARWNLKVPRVYEGLLWVGALQVDPGWQGHLSCPIYNMSNREVSLEYKGELFAMDFVRTTPFMPQSSKEYVQKPGVGPSGSVHTYDRVGLRSGPYNLIRQVEDIEGEVRQLESRIGLTLGLLIGLVTLVVTALAALLVVSINNSKGFDIPVVTTAGVGVIIGTVALVAAVAPLIGRVFLRFRANKDRNGRSKG